MVDELSRKVNLLLKRNALVNEKCAFCGVLEHDEINCGMARQAGVGCDEVNFVGGFPNTQPRNSPYSNTYNLGWRHHPNCSWKDSSINTNQVRPMRFLGYQHRPPPPFNNINTNHYSNKKTKIESHLWKTCLCNLCLR